MKNISNMLTEESFSASFNSARKSHIPIFTTIYRHVIFLKIWTKRSEKSFSKFT